jgi:hypothetical protein
MLEKLGFRLPQLRMAISCHQNFPRSGEMIYQGLIYRAPFISMARVNARVVELNLQSAGVSHAKSRHRRDVVLASPEPCIFFLHEMTTTVPLCFGLSDQSSGQYVIRPCT